MQEELQYAVLHEFVALVRALELLEDEVRRCLGLLGVTSFGELDRSYISPIVPLAREGWESAFPLIKEGY
jgi:glycolate oxidase